MNKLNRIAKKIWAYKTLDISSKLGKLFLNGHNLPLYYVINIAPDSYRVYKFNKEVFKSRADKAYILNKVYYYLVRVGYNSFDKVFASIIEWSKIFNIEELANLILKEVDVSVPDFEKHFEPLQKTTESNDTFQEIKHHKWRVILEQGIKDSSEVIELLNNVERKCSKLMDLCYGVIEVKKSLGSSKRLADYSPSNDSIRIKSKSSDDLFVRSFIHELGHRLWYKRLDVTIKRSIYNKYYELSGKKRLPFKENDILELDNGYKVRVKRDAVFQSLVEIIEMPRKSKKISPGQTVVYRNLTLESVKSINGKESVVSEFPTLYSRKNPEEFFCEVFSFWLMNNLNKDLSNWLDNIL